jgi:hypothetical protein
VPPVRIRQAATQRLRVSELLKKIHRIAPDTPVDGVELERPSIDDHLADWKMRSLVDDPEVLRRKTVEHTSVEELPDPKGILPESLRKSTRVMRSPDPAAMPGILDLAEQLAAKKPDKPLAELLDPFFYEADQKELDGPPEYRLSEGSETDGRGRPKKTIRQPIKDAGRIRMSLEQALSIMDPVAEERIGQTSTLDLGTEAAKLKAQSEGRSDYMDALESASSLPELLAKAKERGFKSPRPADRALDDWKSNAALARKQGDGPVAPRDTVDTLDAPPATDSLVPPDQVDENPLTALREGRQRALLVRRDEFPPGTSELEIQEYLESGDLPDVSRFKIKGWRDVVSPGVRTPESLEAAARAPQTTVAGHLPYDEAAKLTEARRALPRGPKAAGGLPNKEKVWPATPDHRGVVPHSDAWYKQVSAETGIPPKVLFDLVQAEPDAWRLVYPEVPDRGAVQTTVQASSRTTTPPSGSFPIDKVEPIGDAGRAIPRSALPPTGLHQKHPVQGTIVDSPEGPLSIEDVLSMQDKVETQTIYKDTARGLEAKEDFDETVTPTPKTEQLLRGRLLENPEAAQALPIKGAKGATATVRPDAPVRMVKRQVYPRDPAAMARDGWHLLKPTEQISVDPQAGVSLVGINPKTQKALVTRLIGDFAEMPIADLPPAVQQAARDRWKGTAQGPGLGEGVAIVVGLKGGITQIAHKVGKAVGLPVRGHAFKDDAASHGLSPLPSYETRPGQVDADMIDPATKKLRSGAAQRMRARFNIGISDATLVLSPYTRGESAAHTKSKFGPLGGGTQETWRETLKAGKPAPVFDLWKTNPDGSWSEPSDAIAFQIADWVTRNGVKALHIEGPRDAHLSTTGNVLEIKNRLARVEEVLAKTFTLLKQGSPTVAAPGGERVANVALRDRKAPPPFPGKAGVGRPLQKGAVLEGEPVPAVAPPYTEHEAADPAAGLELRGKALEQFARYLKLKADPGADPAELEKLKTVVRELVDRAGVTPADAHAAPAALVEVPTTPKVKRGTPADFAQARLAEPILQKDRRLLPTAPETSARTVPDALPAARQPNPTDPEFKTAKFPKGTDSEGDPIPRASVIPGELPQTGRGGVTLKPSPVALPAAARVQVPEGVAPVATREPDALTKLTGEGLETKRVKGPAVQQVATLLEEAAAELEAKGDAYDAKAWGQKFRTLLGRLPDPSKVLMAALAAVSAAGLSDEEPETTADGRPIVQAGFGIPAGTLSKVLQKAFEGGKTLRDAVPAPERAPETPPNAGFDRLDAQRRKATVAVDPRTIGERATGALLDDKDPLYRYSEEMKKRGAAVPPGEDARDIVRTEAGGGAARAEPHVQALRPIIADLEKEALVPAFTRALDALSTLRAWDTTESGAADLVKQASALRRQNEFTKANDLLRQAETLQRNRREGTVAPGRLSREDATKAIDELRAALRPEQFNLVFEAIDTIETGRLKLIDAWEAEGIKTAAEAAALRKRTNYVPIRYKDGTYRVEDDAFLVPQRSRAEALRAAKAAGKTLSLPEEKLVQEFLGSGPERLVSENPFEAWLSYHQEGWNEIARNRVAKATVAQVKTFPELAWNPRTATGIKPLREGEAPATGYTSIGFYENGKPTRWMVPQSWGDALTLSQPEDLSLATKALSAVRRNIQKLMTTANPLFLMRNVPRDIQDALMLTPGLKATDVGAFAKLWAQKVIELRGQKDPVTGRIAVPQTPARQAYIDSGAHMSHLSANIDQASYLKGDPKLRSKNPVANLVGRVQRANDITERATKETVFELLRKNNPSLPASKIAAWTREFGGSPDFAVHGSASQMIGNFVTFFNPAIQGSARTIRAYKQNPEKVQQHLVGIGAAALALAGFNEAVRIKEITN